MQIEFQVIRDGDTIFKRPFMVKTESDIPDYSKVAMEKFSHAHPGNSILDDDVLFVWRAADPHKDDHLD